MNRERAVLLAIVLLGLLLRIAVTWTWSDRLNEDTDGYRGIATQLIRGNGYANSVTGNPTAFRPPAFPLLLALLLAVTDSNAAIACFQILAGTATVAVTGLVAMRTTIRFHWLAPLLVAVDPLTLAYTPRVMTEVLSALLLALLLLSVTAWQKAGADTRREPVVFGLVLGLAALCRPTVWALVPFALLSAVLFAKRHGKPWRKVLQPIAFAAVGAAIVVGPWVLRNLVVLGSPVFATTHGGYTLLLGNNPEFYRTVARNNWDTIWDSEPWQAKLRSAQLDAGIDLTDERATDRWMYDRATASIRSDPGGFMRASFVRVRRFWHVLPLVETQNALVTWSVGGFYVLVLAGVVASLFRSERGSPVLMIAWCLVLAFATVHVAYWSNARMRAPLVAALAVLSARGWGGHHRSGTPSQEDII